MDSETLNDDAWCPAWLTEPVDVNALDSAIWCRSAVRDADGVVDIAGLPLTDAAEEFGTPVYLLDEADFRGRAREFRAAFSGWQVYYAGKAFLCRRVVSWVMDEGLCLDVCSGEELRLALRAGAEPSRIGLHGNNKSVDELALALRTGVGRVVVDSMQEIGRIERLCADNGWTARVLVRVTPGVHAETHEYIATSHEDQKFGLSIASGAALEALLACQAATGVQLLGVHQHIGSQIFAADGYQIAIGRVMALLAGFERATGVRLDEYDIGGGFGIAYTSQDAPATPASMAARLNRMVADAAGEVGLAVPKLSLEPGRSIVGPAGTAVYTVGTVKPVTLEDGRQRVYVSVDGGMSDNIRPALYEADYTAVIANRTSAAPSVLCRVVGKHCETGDILVRDVYLPADIAPGDLLAVPASGAYSRMMASNYNMAPRPPVVAVVEGTGDVLIRRETFDDLLRLDVG
jgi:diaminopimelate decarboxylase